MLPALLALTGCWSTGEPALPGRVLWVHEQGEQITAAWSPAGAPAQAVTLTVDGAAGATFPGPPDPQGTHALLLHTTDDAAGHREQLWLKPLDGGEAIALGPPAQMVRNPAWSPDGEWLVVESDAASFRDLYRVERDGSGWRRLTDDALGNFEPDVAPDGAIAFISSRDRDAELYVMGPEGQAPLRITTRPGTDSRPRWSPDGARIAWLVWRGEQVLVHVLERGQTQGQPLRADPHPGEVDLDLAWSPRGDRIAITTVSGPRDRAVDIVALSGERIARLDGSGPDEHPAWSPDGAHLVFSSSRAGQPDLYVVRADGTALRPLVSGAEPEWLPRWMP